MDEQHSGRLSLGSWALRGRPAVPEDLRPVLITRGVENLSRLSLASVRGPPMSTSSPGRLALVSEGPRCPPALPGDSRSGRWPALSTSCPGDSGPCLRSCGLNQMSRATWGLAPVPAGSKSSPARLGPGSDGLRSRPNLTSDTCLVPWTHGVDKFSRWTRDRAEGSRGPPALPGDSGPCLRYCGLNQMSRETWGRVPVPAGTTSSAERLALGPVGPRGQPVLLGDSSSGRGPAGSTSSPGRLALGSDGPQG